MPDACLLCGAPLVYTETAVPMTCALCGKAEDSRACCEKGHYVCDNCHIQGIGSALTLCLMETSKDPIAILEKLMALPFCHMHGPEHHSLVGMSLLTAWKNAGGDLDLPRALAEMLQRGKQIPGGVCGFWGACGAGVSTGIFVSIATGATPLAGRAWGLANRMTGRALSAIGAVGGPRCCKRDAFLAVTEAAAFADEELGVRMEPTLPRCTHSAKNAQCLGTKCPFHMG